MTMNTIRYILPLLLTCGVLTLGYTQGPYQIAGTVATQYQESVGQVVLTLSDDTGSVVGTYETDCDGSYQIGGLFGGQEYTLTLEKEGSFLNGVSTFDFVLIQRHMMGVQLLGSPYDVYGADLDGSGAVTVTDLVLLQALVLAIIEELPGGNWHFFENGVTAPQASFSVMVNADLLDYDFVAVKKGDVNGSAITCD